MPAAFSLRLAVEGLRLAAPLVGPTPEELAEELLWASPIMAVELVELLTRFLGGDAACVEDIDKTNKGRARRGSATGRADDVDTHAARPTRHPPRGIKGTPTKGKTRATTGRARGRAQSTREQRPTTNEKRPTTKKKRSKKRREKRGGGGAKKKCVTGEKRRGGCFLRANDGLGVVFARRFEDNPFLLQSIVESSLNGFSRVLGLIRPNHGWLFFGSYPGTHFHYQPVTGLDRE